ncbi:hypothetical protein [Moorena sp. SIO2C4]|uniref:Uncharacterized protein n=1 Tax=Moorena producens 3L TaxID=489825 RepID=F4Y078_9CYAN|nr:hypothetical protein [Moorena sp. SIO2C4]EGJ29810.1 hypothetical protein LYNGBM3L_60330 [Moorena producens 3L]NEQ17434.1 hypothetical protein [Moorena sp. SIO3E2]NES40736.1 hypothetical protein [Moorena sp. SIO2C4]
MRSGKVSIQLSANALLEVLLEVLSANALLEVLLEVLFNKRGKHSNNAELSLLTAPQVA